MMFAAAVGHRSGRATPSLRNAPQRQSMEIVRRETIYRNRNAVQTNPATSADHRIKSDGRLRSVSTSFPGSNIEDVDGEPPAFARGRLSPAMTMTTGW
jgi:hypothetical protein